MSDTKQASRTYSLRKMAEGSRHECYLLKLIQDGKVVRVHSAKSRSYVQDRIDYFMGRSTR